MNKTLVFQSFRTVDVPSWMNDCMTSVRAWAAHKGYDYRFLDDRFFAVVPSHYREVVRNQRHLMADLARLVWTRRFLDEGWNKVIWVDADVVVLAQDSFDVEGPESYYLCREVWVHGQDERRFSERINNAVMVFDKGNSFLAFYEESCHRIVESKRERLSHAEVGTAFLSHLFKPMTAPLINTVALLSPALLIAHAEQDITLIENYEERFGRDIYATNLCLTFRGQKQRGRYLSDDFFKGVIRSLQARYGS